MTLPHTQSLMRQCPASAFPGTHTLRVTIPTATPSPTATLSPSPPSLPPSLHSCNKNNKTKINKRSIMPPVRLKLTYEGRTFRRTVDAVTFNWTQFLEW